MSVPKPQLRSRYAVLPELLRDLRDRAGLTQRELAEKLGLPQNTIYRMEQGIRRCDALELIDWCQACNASPRSAFSRLIERTS
ncbi:MAG: helix-turn-helix transcriptional regulator [Pseudomonadota bacterium]